MKIGHLQFKPELHNPPANTEKVSDLIGGADFDLLVIPELANSGYLLSSLDELAGISENPDSGKYCSMLKKISRKKNACIVSGFCESTKDGSQHVYYNSSILVFPDGKFRIYRKTHLFYKEKNFFQ